MIISCHTIVARRDYVQYLTVSKSYSDNWTCSLTEQNTTLKNLYYGLIYTHYHNSKLIWRTVSRRVGEVTPSDHPRRVASRVIQWYGLIH